VRFEAGDDVGPTATPTPPFSFFISSDTRADRRPAFELNPRVYLKKSSFFVTGVRGAMEQ
jgi:hypothetical protein